MHVSVDLPAGDVRLGDWSLMTVPVVLVAGGPGVRRDEVSEWRLRTVLDGAGVAFDPGRGDASVPPSVLRDLAGAAAAAEGTGLDDEWDEGFAGMLATAASKGRIDDAGAVRAPVEWRDA